MKIPSARQIKAWEHAAAQLALYIARDAVIGNLEMENEDDEDYKLPPDEEIDAMARKAVELYDDDNVRAECWNHALWSVV
jgi:hypothetical protein